MERMKTLFKDIGHGDKADLFAVLHRSIHTQSKDDGCINLDDLLQMCGNEGDSEAIIKPEDWLYSTEERFFCLSHVAINAKENWPTASKTS